GMIATIGVPNPERPGSELVKAYIALKPEIRNLKNPEVLKNEILNFAIDRLAPYEVPKFIEFRDELPLTPVGKIDKKILRKENARSEDRRRNMRKSVDLPCDVRLTSEGKEARKPGNIVDISTEGVGVETEEPIETGAGEDAYIDIIQFGKTFWLKGHVLGYKGNRIAVRFIETLPRELKEILSP
ncbi:MAG: PilZ domain-containing protein, partial [Deltaproteobacteria bacterium]|nr:PilZ domain-containing protein [Deltaproteobacteria bacterium]